VDDLLASLVDVDTVCINQDDEVECRQQVGTPCNLFTHLSRLIVWLGVDDEQDSKKRRPSN
jgi:hypothetical protein